MEDKNRAFNEMYVVGKNRLKGRNPVDISEKARVEFCEDTQSFKVRSLDKTVELSYPSYECKEKVDKWYILILLHYLDIADGKAVYHEPVRFGQLKDGLIRGVRFDKTVERELESFLLNKKEDEVINVFKSLGGQVVPSKFDLTVVFYLFPNYPVTLNVWFADEEFGATGHMLVDKSADHYLTIEDSVVAGELMLRCFGDRYEKLYGDN